ncbi:MAG: hypothetical protein EKK33_10585 [Bradyrhizobiaceae bacterium]|nr:MAG: hypothetical protein EKK33_10585 [Bradyrhizobiaceae bacterium]
MLKQKILLGCLLLCAVVTPLHVAHSAEIGIPSATTNAAGAKALALIVDGPSFSWPIVIRRNDSGGSALPVRVDVTSLQGRSAQTANPLHLSMDGRDVAVADFDLSALDQKEIRLSGTLPVEDEFTGQLGIIVEGNRIPYELKVTRRKPENPPKARFVGATSDGKLAMTSDKSSFEWPLVLRRDDALKQVVEVMPRVSLMSGPAGTIIEPKLLKDGNPITGPISLPSLGQQSLKLVGTADREGSYTGEISYDIDGNATTVTLTLNRTHPDLDFKIEPITKTFATAGSPVTLQLRMLNNSSMPREIYPPSIVQFERTSTLGSGPIQVAAGDYQVAFRRQDDKPLRPLTADGDGELTLAATVTGLTTTGSYKGVMRFTAPDRKPADVAFELSLRLWWVWPALAIAVGVLLSALLRYYQSTGQPRLLVQRNALELRSNLTTLLQSESRNLNDQEKNVFTHLIAQIDEASDKLADPSAPIETASTIIDAARRRSSLLTPWITYRRRRDTLPAAIADLINADLKAVYDTLTNDSASDSQVATAKERLAGIDAKINNGLKDGFNEAGAALTRAIDEFAPADRPQFAPVTTLVATLIAEANRFRFDKAEEALAQARSKFAEIAAGLLRATLSVAQPAVGFEAADWSAFITEITGLLDGVITEPDSERRVQLWNEANRRYLTKVVQRAKARVETLIQAGVVGTEEALSRARSKLVEAEAALSQGKLGAARTSYQEAVDEAAGARKPLQQQGLQMGKTPAADSDAPNSGAVLPDSIIMEAVASLWPLPLGRDVTLAQVTRRMRWSSIGFAFFLLLIAIASGLQLLYFPNPAFGCADLIVAFLWGAGLHAIAGQTFQGLSGLAQQLR